MYIIIINIISLRFLCCADSMIGQLAVASSR